MDYERPMTRIDSRNGTPVQHVGALRLDRRAHPRARRRARRLLLPHPQPDRREARPDHVAPTSCERLIDKLDPEREPGRLTFITRMGAGKIRDALPPLLEAIKRLRRDAAVGHRPDARQRHHHADRLQDAPLRRRRRRGAAASSRRTAPSARTRAASTSSSPATTSPSASAARSTSTRRPSRPATSRSATRG